MRRAVVDVDYYGYQPLLAAISRRAEAPAGLDDGALAALGAHSDERVRRAAELAQALFTWDGRAIRFLGPAPNAAVVEALARHLASPAASREPTPEETGRRFAHVVVGAEGSKESHDFAFARLPDGRLVGFEARLDVVGERIARACSSGPCFRLRSATGTSTTTRSSSASSTPPGPSACAPARPHGTRCRPAPRSGRPTRGVLEGWTVEAAIDPAAAPPSRDRRSAPIAAAGARRPARGHGRAPRRRHRAARRERALGRLRAEFVASVSHELRTPLTQIRMFAETLLLDRVRSAEERAARSRSSTGRRGGSRTSWRTSCSSRAASAGRSRVAPRARRLAPLVREVLDDSGRWRAGAGARTIARRSHDGAAAAVDADALRQILLNLLDNAVKYGPREQEVRVALETRGRHRAAERRGRGARAFRRRERRARLRALRAAGARSRPRRRGHRHRPRGGARARASCTAGARASRTGARGGARFVVELPGGRGPRREPHPGGRGQRRPRLRPAQQPRDRGLRGRGGGGRRARASTRRAPRRPTS